MERKITIEESVPYTEDYQNKMLEENQVEGLLEMHGRGEWMTKAVMIMM